MRSPIVAGSLFSLGICTLVAVSMTAAASAATATAPTASVRVDAYLGLWEGVDALVCIDDGNGKHGLDPVSTEYQLRSRGKVLVIPALGSSLPIVMHRLTQ